MPASPVVVNTAVQDLPKPVTMVDEDIHLLTNRYITGRATSTDTPDGHSVWAIIALSIVVISALFLAASAGLYYGKDFYGVLSQLPLRVRLSNFRQRFRATSTQPQDTDKPVKMEQIELASREVPVPQAVELDGARIEELPAVERANELPATHGLDTEELSGLSRGRRYIQDNPDVIEVIDV